ncbi:sigma factor-like helix-turn-helix DNA-binding protein [Enterococcus wangshanyuanii]|uniref:Positive control factor n=1 Tax=Enterococcus wangshanyuanii TaxID=2005703 RepID=A0ABQ1PK15_9ENTE|nr:sigma factor-like helix-turn-helix DNA-binding protein [Enterococcus wangshanyuanii]GGC98170.1 positive control factor [Enterococcus wangshanyuanii]
MLDWENREILIREYKEDLKEASREHRKIVKKEKWEKTADDIKEQAIYAEIISSTQYALYWLEHGIERPLDEEAAKKIPKHRRAKHITNMDKVSYDVYLNQYEAPVQEVYSEKKKEQLIRVREILSKFSDREADLFYYIHTVGMTYGEAAKEMKIEVGTVKSMSQRIKNKIDRYFEYGHQISLF